MAVVTLKPQSEDENGGFAAIPAGETLEVEVLSIVEGMSPWLNETGDKEPIWEIAFKVVEAGQYRNRRIWDTAPRDTDEAGQHSSSGKFRFWAQALLGLDQLPGTLPIDTDDLVGLHALAEVGMRTSKKDATKEFNYIQRLRAIEDAPVDTF